MFGNFYTGNDIYFILLRHYIVIAFTISSQTAIVSGVVSDITLYFLEEEEITHLVCENKLLSFV